MVWKKRKIEMSFPCMIARSQQYGFESGKAPHMDHQQLTRDTLKHVLLELKMNQTEEFTFKEGAWLEKGDALGVINSLLKLNFIGNHHGAQVMLSFLNKIFG